MRKMRLTFVTHATRMITSEVFSCPIGDCHGRASYTQFDTLALGSGRLRCPVVVLLYSTLHSKCP
jgi:hypothetical protein